jgi:hypothetical protein
MSYIYNSNDPNFYSYYFFKNKVVK